MAGLLIPHYPQIETDIKYDDDWRAPSITTIIGKTGSPDGLIWWACDKTARFAIDNLDEWIHEEPDDQFSILRKSRFRKVEGERSESELGSAIHAAFEYYLINQKRPKVDAEVLPYVDQFIAWCDTVQPESIAIEATCYNKTIGYAGTIDYIAKIDGVTCIIDWKTTRKSKDSRGKKSMPRAEAVALQLAAGRFSEFIAAHHARRYSGGGGRYYLLSEDEQASSIPTASLNIEAGVVVHVAADHFDPYPIRTDERVFDFFVNACEITRWLDVECKNVLGDRMNWEG